MRKYRVTEDLRRVWAAQVAQDREERLVDHRGLLRDPASVAALDHDIAVREALLRLPIGTVLPRPINKVLERTQP